MMITPAGYKEDLYCFRGKVFKADEWTIKQLNYALALNRSPLRYDKVTSELSKENTFSNQPAA